jgi:hypothetical protein
MLFPDMPTYRVEVDGETTTYFCLYCEDQDTEHHATDMEFFVQHMEQRHDGRMLEEQAAARAASETDAEAPGEADTSDEATPQPVSPDAPLDAPSDAAPDGPEEPPASLPPIGGSAELEEGR